MKKIIMSAGTLVFAGALVVSATGAFFSDTETSTGNTFAAGAIDLRIDNTSYAIDNNIPGFVDPQGVLVANPENSWELVDLTIERFFDFIDLKPGDYGEGTISIHVDNNDAWLCAAAQVTEDLDNTFTEPEDEVSGANNDGNDGTPDGDLDSAVTFAFWEDDGDNVLESDEAANVFLSGPLSNLGSNGVIALADSAGGPLGPGPVAGGSDLFVGTAWCYGTMSADPVSQDGVNTGSPLTLGTGFDCDGSGVGNIGQTDSVEGDIQFYAVQSRNNANFTCAGDFDPDFPEGPNDGPVVVNENNLGIWEIRNFDNDDASDDNTTTVSGTNADFVTGPGTPGEGTGSLEQDLGTDGNDATRILTSNFNGMALSAFTELEYATYVQNFGSGGQASYMQLRIDRDGDGDLDDTLFFEPVYQSGSYGQLGYAPTPVPDQCSDPNCVVLSTWQTWDADAGGWWSNADSGGGPPLTTLADYIAQYPGAKLVTDSPALRITSGFGSGAWDNFLGNVDYVTINGTTYNFEN